MTNVVARGFDAGVRLGENVQRDMVAVRITPDLRMAVVASPDYFATRTAPRTPQDLHEHGCINYRWVGSGTLCRWEFEKDGKTCQIAVEGPLTLNDPDLIVGAALDGVGLAHVVESRVSSDLAAGRLLRVLVDWCQPFPGFFLYYPGHRQRPGALSALIELLQIRDDGPCPSALDLPI